MNAKPQAGLRMYALPLALIGIRRAGATLGLAVAA